MVYVILDNEVIETINFGKDKKFLKSETKRIKEAYSKLKLIFSKTAPKN